MFRFLNELAGIAMAWRSPFGANESQGSPAPRNGPPEQTVRGIGTCCQVLPPSDEVAETIFWKGPWIQAATIFFGFTGFTTTQDSAASLMVPGPGPAMPSSQVPTALGRDSSISGPSVAAGAFDTEPTRLASVTPARPTPNFLSAARRVTDWARLLVSSSNWLFIHFLSFGCCGEVAASIGVEAEISLCIPKEICVRTRRAGDVGVGAFSGGSGLQA